MNGVVYFGFVFTLLACFEIVAMDSFECIQFVRVIGGGPGVKDDGEASFGQLFSETNLQPRIQRQDCAEETIVQGPKPR